MMRWLIVMLLATAVPAHAQIYKCQEGGRTVYAQTPCSTSAEVLNIKRSPPRPGSFEEVVVRREDYVKDHPGLSEVVKGAILGGVAIPGMTEEQALVALGPPVDRNLTQTATMSRWQWVYRWPSGKQYYIYIENGVVVATN